jgi:beta-galactosidase
VSLTRRKILQGLTAVAGSNAFGSLSALTMGEPGRPGSIDPWSRYWIGTSYYPEQWSRSQWAQDFAKMQDLGVNTVRMGEFAWSSMEPLPGHFEFGWLDEAIGLAQQKGISVILGTPTASIPPWLYRLHPDALGGNEKGPYTYGGRKGFVPENPAMIDAARQVIEKLASRYGSNPTVIGWQLSNEPGHPMVNYNHQSLLAFRDWLKQRYGTVAKLNAAWSGTFWSNEYDQWDEIVFPVNSAEGGWNPGIQLDYRRFFSDSFLKWLRFEAALVKKSAHDQFIYTNWPDTRWSVDIRQTTPFLDTVGWDNYGALPGEGESYNLLHTGLDHDNCRCSRQDQRFFVSEQPSQPPVELPTESVRLATYIDMAHGSAGTIFFEFRPPVIGTERAYVSMLEASGDFGRSAGQFRKMKQELARVGPLLANAKTVADIALVYSYQNQWEQGSSWNDRANPTAYDKISERHYAGLRSLRRNVDVVGEAAEMSRYQLVAAPGFHMVSDEMAAAFKSYVHAGGILVLDHKAGCFDEDARFRPLLEPGVFGDIAGIRIPASLEQHRSSFPGYRVVFEHSTRSFAIDDYMLKMELTGAEVLARFTGEGMEGDPAVTVNRYGQGHVVYVGAGIRDAHFFDELYTQLADKFKITPLLSVPDGVTVLSRQNQTYIYTFVLNLNKHEVTIKLPTSFREVIVDKDVFGSIRIAALDLAILQTKL